MIVTSNNVATAIAKLVAVDALPAIGRSKICGLCKARRVAVDQLAHEVMLMKHTIQEMQRVIGALIEKSRIPDTKGTAIERAPQRWQ